MLQNIIQKREIKVFNVYIPYLEGYNNKYISFEQADLKRTKLQQKATILKKNQQISIYFLVIALPSSNAFPSADRLNALHFDMVDFISAKLVCFSATIIALSVSALKSFMVLWNNDISLFILSMLASNIANVSAFSLLLLVWCLSSKT